LKIGHFNRRKGFWAEPIGTVHGHSSLMVGTKNVQATTYRTIDYRWRKRDLKLSWGLSLATG
jgi:hypothetical protein